MPEARPPISRRFASPLVNVTWRPPVGAAAGIATVNVPCRFWPTFVLETVIAGSDTPVLVRVKLAGDRPATEAVTVYCPAVPFAVMTGEVAMPAAFVVILTVFPPVAKVRLGPLAGAVNVTVTPATGVLLTSLTVATNWFVN